MCRTEALKSVTRGCLGFGSCVKACAFDALHIEDGIAVVDREKCKACGKCITACPQHLIDLVPYEQKTLVKCKVSKKAKQSSRDATQDVSAV